MTTVNIEFTEMKKNSKHQVMKFTFNGEDTQGKGEQLYKMSGGIVVCEIDGCEIGKFNAEFFEQKRTSKGFVLQMRIQGDVNNDAAGKLYAFSGRNIDLTLEQAQMSIDEFYDGEDGKAYTVDTHGVVEMEDDNQLNMDDVIAQEEESGENVADISKERAKRTTKKEKEAEAAAAALLGEDDDLMEVDHEENNQ